MHRVFNIFGDTFTICSYGMVDALKKTINTQTNYIQKNIQIKNLIN